MRFVFYFFLVAIIGSTVSAQTLSFSRPDWNSVHEGDYLTFKVVSSDSVPVQHYYLDGNEPEGMQLDNEGNFSWTPGFDLVSASEKKKELIVVFAARLMDDRTIREEATFILYHTNQKPIVEELPVFYVRQGLKNTYTISSDYVMDPDGDQIVFKPILNEMPEGMQLSASGVITWTPGRSQFAGLKNGLVIDFNVLDQPGRVETRGKLKIAQTQQDLPPELILVPGDTVYTLKEDESVSLKLYFSDPNGDDNLARGGFVSSDARIPKSVLQETSPQQSEFNWTPGYKFVDEAEKSKLVEITFYAIDKEANRVQRKLKIRVSDTENLDEKDKLTYQKYKSTLVNAKGLMDQLDQKHSELTKLYKQAKKGKKNRAILNASLGATTGLSPLILPTESSKVISGLGGTTVLTLGTLEATEVIGRSKNDILDQMNICVEIRNQLQIEGDVFARKYALKSERRKKEFDSDREKMLPIINNKKLLLLELDASQRTSKIDGKDLKKTFTDYSEEN
jgi:hypothetical protein